MRILSIEVIPVRLPLRTPWVTAGGTMTDRASLLVHVRTDVGDGWGECVALPDPGYSEEFVAGARVALERELAPRVLSAGVSSAAEVAPALSVVIGNRMAKAAIEMAVLDAELRAADRSFAEHLGVDVERVDAGVAIGLVDDLGELCERVGELVDEGYRRVKLKIAPGRDLTAVEAVRERFPALALMVDANGAYTLADVDRLAALDEFGLLLVEQPLAPDDLVGHARVADAIATPVCLDEPIVSIPSLEAAVELGACEVVNCKPGRVGGYLAAVAMHDWCVERSLPLWCGGMVETGLARAANVALAGLPGFTMPGDLSASSRFFEQDIVTDPVTVAGGCIDVPRTPGIGATIDPDALARFRTS